MTPPAMFAAGAVARHMPPPTRRFSSLERCHDITLFLRDIADAGLQ
jgi:hypothetical protein